MAGRRSARWPRPASAPLAGARFVALPSRDQGVLPAVAALEPAQAVAHLTVGGWATVVARAAHANRFLERLRASHVDSYLLKVGRVGGTDPADSLEVKDEHVAAILNGVLAGTVEWERDPDFGYRVAAEVPGIDGRDRFLLIPRFSSAHRSGVRVRRAGSGAEAQVGRAARGAGGSRRRDRPTPFASGSRPISSAAASSAPSKSVPGTPPTHGEIAPASR